MAWQLKNIPNLNYHFLKPEISTTDKRHFCVIASNYAFHIYLT